MEMEFRAQARIVAIIALATPALFAQPLQYEARHGRSHGTLTIDTAGVSFQDAKGRHAWRWAYQDIQQLKIAPASLTLLTYKDNKWKLGADREYSFTLPAGKTFTDAYDLLK